MSATLIAQTFDGCVTCGKREADPYHRPCALRDDRTADGWNTLTHAHHHPFTRPATESDPSVVASDADTFNVEPSPDAPTHTGEDQAVGGDRKTVDSLHSSGRCKCAAFSMRRMQELGEIIGFQEAIAKVREVVTDPTSRQQIDSVVAREFPALFEKLSGEVDTQKGGFA
jgi:hypothetical protein